MEMFVVCNCLNLLLSLCVTESRLVRDLNVIMCTAAEKLCSLYKLYYNYYRIFVGLAVKLLSYLVLLDLLMPINKENHTDYNSV